MITSFKSSSSWVDDPESVNDTLSSCAVDIDDELDDLSSSSVSLLLEFYMFVDAIVESWFTCLRSIPPK